MPSETKRDGQNNVMYLRYCSYLFNVTFTVEDPIDADVGHYTCSVETVLGMQQASPQLVIYGTVNS